MKRTVRFNLGDLLPIGMTFVVLGIGLAFGLNVMHDVKDDTGKLACSARTDGYTAYNSSNGFCQNVSATTDGQVGQVVTPGTADFNATGDAITGVAKLPSKLPIIATVVVAALIIGILVRFLAVKYM